MDSAVDFFYDQSLRWGFGFDNPNKAAVIFACLLPLGWLLWSLSWRIKIPWVKWFCVLLAGGAILADGFCLFKTYSRGGTVAALAGVLYFIWKSTRLESGWLKSIQGTKFYANGILGILLVVLFVWLGLGERSVEPFTNDDASVSHRLILWRSGLEMAVDNPLGFGTGHSGEAYMQWYQPLGMTAGYRTMVNSYLTFLVEQGWLLSALVLVIHLSFWLWAIPPTGAATFEGMVGLRASMLAFLVSGIFSTVMEELLLWMIPGVCLVALIVGARLQPKPTGRNLSTACLISFIILAVLYVGGIVQRQTDPFRHECGIMDGRHTVIGVALRKSISEPAPVWVVIPDKKILGNSYGKLLRQLVLKTGISLEIQDETKPLSVDTPLLLIGHAVQTNPITSDRPVVLLSPIIIPREQAIRWIKSNAHLSVLLPGIDEDGRTRFWQDNADSEKLDQKNIKKLDGVGLRIDWAWADVMRLIAGFK